MCLKEWSVKSISAWGLTAKISLISAHSGVMTPRTLELLIDTEASSERVARFSACDKRETMRKFNRGTFTLAT